MSYITPKTDYDELYELSPTDMNRIEGNVKHIKDENGTIEGNKTFTGDNIHTGQEDFQNDSTFSGNNTFTGENSFTQTVDMPSINTGQGDNEVYAMDQDVRTTDSVRFESVSTIQESIVISDGATTTLSNVGGGLKIVRTFGSGGYNGAQAIAIYIVATSTVTVDYEVKLIDYISIGSDIDFFDTNSGTGLRFYDDGTDLKITNTQGNSLQVDIGSMSAG